MADWLQPTITLLPFAAWMFLGVGIPWALALLPRSLWTERITVIAVGMALGPLGLTSVMFILGTLGKLTLTWTMAGSAILALMGAIITLERRIVDPSLVPARVRPRLSWMAWSMMLAIALLVAVNVIVTAYWPFVAYDPQWVYAYNAKIFVMEEKIPTEIGYYPQMIPLSYTYMQQAWGGINDHAARVVIPWFNVSMILMAYTLGRRVFGSRRTGLFTAAIWTFYPHVAAWAGAGDLEIPLTLYVTGASAFFIDAWRTDRERSAIISGVLFSGALWTKPTGGAWALGVALAIIGWSWLTLFRLPSFGPRHRIALILTRGILARFWIPLVWTKLRLALITALACAPLGGMWYLRNLAYGHAAVDFPADYWNSFAQRSGQEMGWPILIAALTAGWLLVHPPASLRRRTPFVRYGWPILAVAALIVASLPSALNWQHTNWNDLWIWIRGDMTAVRRMSRDEILLFVAGLGMLTWPTRGAWRTWANQRRESVMLLWALLLPYGIVWLFYYSYHYRLSFAIVPLLVVQVAALLDWWVLPWMRTRRIGQVMGIVLMVGLVLIALKAGTQHTYRHLLDNDLSDDTAKYDASNPALMVVVHHLEAYAAEYGEPVVSAPGEDRLPFYFPTWDIRIDRDHLPTKLEDLDGVDIFITGSVLEFLWREADLLPNSLQADANVGAAYHNLNVMGMDGQPLPTVLQPIPLHATGALPTDDGTFRYMMYRVHPEARAVRFDSLISDEVYIGDFAQYEGSLLGNSIFYRGERVYFTLLWHATTDAPPARDYSVYIHLMDANGEKIAQWDGIPMQNSYPTRFWRPDEYLMDVWVLTIPADTPTGAATLRFGLYDPLTQERLRVTVNGVPAGDGIEFPIPLTVQ